MSPQPRQFRRFALSKHHIVGLTVSALCPWPSDDDSRLTELIDENGYFANLSQRDGYVLRETALRHTNTSDGSLGLYLSFNLFPANRSIVSTSPQRRKEFFDAVTVLRNEVTIFVNTRFEFNQSEAETLMTSVPLPLDFRTGNLDLPYDEIRGVRIVKTPDPHSSDPFGYDALIDRPMNTDVTVELQAMYLGHVDAQILERALRASKAIVGRLVWYGSEDVNES